MELQIEKYTESHKAVWNDFVKSSKNATFMLDRNYMDYHRDRFTDHSLLLFDKDKIVAIFPANEKNGSIQSHGGLSYGGLLYTTKLRYSAVLNILKNLCEYYKNEGFVEIYYKIIPEMYCSYPSAEIQYALFDMNAELYRRDLSSTIEIQRRLKPSKGRKWLLARAKKLEITIEESNDLDPFFQEYNTHLDYKYDTKAVHAAEEISLLKSRFPKNIKYIQARDNEGFLGGTILYFTKEVVHAQYIHFTNRGKDIGAFDLLMNQLLEENKEQRYFDFGISTEKEGRYLNEGLINFKESFGARATVCDFYKITL